MLKLMYVVPAFILVMTGLLMMIHVPRVSHDHYECKIIRVD